MDHHQIFLAIIAILAWSGFLLGHSHFSKHASDPPTTVIDKNPRSRRLFSSSRGVSSFIDPKSIIPRPADGLVSPEFVAQQEEAQRSDSSIALGDNLELLQHLKRTENLWWRGDYLLSRGKPVSNAWGREEEIAVTAAAAAEYSELRGAEAGATSPFTVCDRAADFAILQNRYECPEFTQTTPLLLLEGPQARGRTGNNLIELLHAIQFSRENNVQIGIMVESWAFKLIHQFWMANTVDGWPGEAWKAHFESVLCMKVFDDEEQLEGWDIIHKTTPELFGETTKLPLGEYMADAIDVLRTLFAHYNTGEGYDPDGKQAEDMCAAINAIFGMEQRKDVIYSVIHSRNLEGGSGTRILGGLKKRTGCDPTAAIEMHPEYIKSILGPLGMLQHPIVIITDGQNPTVIERLLADADIGGLIRVIPNRESSLQGDITLAIMSNVFIGNPASSFSSFIAKSRLALGFGHNELFRAKDERGQWRTVCGDHCVFDTTIMRAIA